MDDITHSMNRSRKVPLYTHPVHSQYNYDYILNDPEEEEGEEELDEENDQESDDNYSSIRYPKRQRKLKTLASDYELVPRNSGRLYGNLNISTDWNDHEKFMLLEVWGDRFLQLGRNSLRSEDWVEVAEKVSELSKVNRNEAQCKQILDVLKRKYKKEKAKCGSGANSKWPFFRKMDMLMKQEFGSGGSGSGIGGNGFSLACGVDSGEFVFMDTNVYLERANGNDEMRDSPCESEEEDEREGEGCGGHEGVKGLRVLADSVQKFGEIYEKIESSKREQMLELERMRVEFQKELELQKKQILEKAQAEIAKIRDGDDEEEDEGEEDDDDDDDDDKSAEDVSE
ncbi:transcription factor, putative [Ricinus communis]|uniref:Transcription factor, putative n=1 Tax=Ricinus communis TaxID=3988 RepID=B9RKU2_RICCO|nr:transcription factor, putative [Ricinus communis]